MANKLQRFLTTALGFEQQLEQAKADGKKEGRAEIARDVAPLMYDLASDKKRPAYAIDNPYAFAVPQSPRKRPMASVDTFTLRSIADTYDIVRALIEHLKREVFSVPIEVVPLDNNDDSEATKARCKEARSWFDTEGGLGGFGVRRQQFESEIIEDCLVIGASAIFYTTNRIGTLLSCKALDSATIRPRIDNYGWMDEVWPYEQWIMGTVTTKFKQTQLRYDGINSRTWSPYFASPLEWLLGPIISGMKADEWNREWLVSGNAPGDDVYTLPAELTPDQVTLYIQVFDEIMSGNTMERRKVRFLPSGSERLSPGTRKDQEFQAFELWLLKRICSVFGVQPASIGYSGEQYKVSQENSMRQTSQFGAGALLEYRKAQYDDILHKNGFGDLEVINVEDAYEDPGERATRLKTLIDGGIYTQNEARNIEGKDPHPDGDELKEINKPEPVVAGGGGKTPNSQKTSADRTALAEMRQWERNMVNRLKRGRGIDHSFVYTDHPVMALLEDHLRLNRSQLNTVADIRDVFKPFIKSVEVTINAD
jgi:hypothetical protein